MARVAGPSAALAGVPIGIQSQGVWMGRRQLFVRFAAEAETATMYTANALASELSRMSQRTVVHSIAITGRDALGNAEFLAAAFDEWKPTVPVMLETDGQRPDALAMLEKRLSLVEVVMDCAGVDAATENAFETLRKAASASCDHALVLCPRDGVSDARLLRIVEQAHAASDGTMIVVHPTLGPEHNAHDRRWTVLMEQALALHPDVQLTLRLPPPVGMR